MAYCAYCGNPVAQVSYTPCPTCARPSNGAPPRPAGSSGANVALIAIGVVVVGLVLIAIAGILAAIAIPNFLTAMQRSKQKRTMADMRSIASAVEMYASDEQRLPEGSSIADLESRLVPKYMPQLPRQDGWEHPLRYSATADAYFIGSGGADRRFDRDALNEYAAGSTTNFDCDIVFSNGKFVQYPEGVQRGGGG
jgi:type II secretory pathway pseudopilin PulG